MGSDQSVEVLFPSLAIGALTGLLAVYFFRSRSINREVAIMSEAKRVVIVGGGFAGAHLAMQLEAQDNIKVTLVDSKEYHEVVFAVPRANIRGRSFGQHLVWNHSAYLKKSDIVVAKCTGMDTAANTISLDNGSTLNYDFLVLCTGVGYTTFKGNGVAVTVEDRLKQFDEEAERIRNANGVIVVGGGPAGFELVGEIADVYPDKKITLISNADRLLATSKPSTSTTAANMIKKNSPNVTVLLKDELDQSQVTEGQRAFKTKAGKEVEGDVVLFAFGTGPSTHFVDKALLDQNRRVKVNPNLIVCGTENVFAAGDITDVQEEKLAYRAEQHAALIAKNIAALAKDPTAKTKDYSPMFPVMVASYGSKMGVAEVPLFGTITRGLPPHKAKDLFVNKVRSGFKLPSARL